MLIGHYMVVCSHAYGGKISAAINIFSTSSDRMLSKWARFRLTSSFFSSLDGFSYRGRPENTPHEGKGFWLLVQFIPHPTETWQKPICSRQELWREPHAVAFGSDILNTKHQDRENRTLTRSEAQWSMMLTLRLLFFPLLNVLFSSITSQDCLLSMIFSMESLSAWWTKGVAVAFMYCSIKVLARVVARNSVVASSATPKQKKIHF